MYAFSGNTPLNAMDANGLFIDAALDVGSIGYDIYRLIQDPCSTENWVALGMDLAGLAIPFATGLGPASRIANHADEVLAGVTHADEAAAYYRISEREIVKPEVAQDAAQLFAERFAESGKTLASSLIDRPGYGGVIDSTGDITLYRGHDAGTVIEEVTHSWQLQRPGIKGRRLSNETKFQLELEANIILKKGLR
jgi:hypothetical protein